MWWGLWYTSRMTTKTLTVTYNADWSNFLGCHVNTFSMREIEVDGIYGKVNKLFGVMMFTLKEDHYDATSWDSPYIYRHDSYEIDEQAWLRTGVIKSLNPDKEKATIQFASDDL